MQQTISVGSGLVDHGWISIGFLPSVKPSIMEPFGFETTNSSARLQWYT